MTGTGWCPPGGCTALTAERLEQVARLAFENGRAYERAELAALEVYQWKPLARRTLEQAVTDRLAEMDQAARDQAARYGRPYRIYPGGPVDWQTGEPLNRSIGAAA